MAKVVVSREWTAEDRLAVLGQIVQEIHFGFDTDEGLPDLRRLADLANLGFYVHHMPADHLNGFVEDGQLGEFVERW